MSNLCYWDYFNLCLFTNIYHIPLFTTNLFRLFTRVICRPQYHFQGHIFMLQINLSAKLLSVIVHVFLLYIFGAQIFSSGT
jgi:hypothetical protein